MANGSDIQAWFLPLEGDYSESGPPIEFIWGYTTLGRIQDLIKHSAEESMYGVMSFQLFAVHPGSNAIRFSTIGFLTRNWTINSISCGLSEIEFD